MELELKSKSTVEHNMMAINLEIGAWYNDNLHIAH